ncbi:UDP-galactose translocator isoform X1 [Athalia rosae]|uniref:UDP-galactose translocator isoform X1 n=2 Tax=Athalia rosae TaxID=37344 RepID=UPI000625233C|nr:UDP-galactose translocator isoform X1 [Athalia rosae]XP_048511113.1 UDP-galactose translocator isoform X1 [Athalia rosae]XP_048511115.1 UDP-galactose translocator isoform X1 [Athalia rosae]XP_048511116.1 UDP-galactose translocator isoform X1 [Athalia rosae]XP_048511117.1 UDP-galactose translocator isoform X1 [Athalia rosae]XP_048511118.1 UDP-galactose translocator isoform X1 [Athalia rosae]XP_048511119.1 UDP-galactose translocator isoform X1 [Athalia rosae]
MPKQEGNPQILKYVSLVTLTLQNAVLGLSMRYARTRAGDMFLSSTAVVMAEAVKLATCLILVYVEEGNFRKFLRTLNLTIIKQPLDTLKVCVPSLVYIIQNNLLYISASHLDAATYQVTYQMKILTTAFFAVLILRKTLLAIQWSALMLLLTGVILVQLDQSKPSSVPSGTEQNHLIGVSAALSACFLSGFAGIYFEKILKGSDISVWMRNVQLSLLSLPFGLFTCFLYDGTIIFKQGFFFGYDWVVYYLVVLQAGGGLVVAMVVKHADNILKGFATSLAIVISCIASIYLFAFHLSLQFATGATLVICSIFMYSHQPRTNDVSDKHLLINKV